MTEHTKTDGLPEVPALQRPAGDTAPSVLGRAAPRNERMAADKVECNACPVLCQISRGKAGACDRYANVEGVLVRVDPVVLLRKAVVAQDATADPTQGQAAGALVPSLVPFAPEGQPWNGELLPSDGVFVTGIGASTTYP
ncbi:MAG TPA: 6-hydroxynicotinate reductase, partial [Rubrivivax sp.]|nr:6-hydroxynicotinate reductase [Rubrivivax sp.]